MGKRSLPPGFRFHPTDVELIRYYLKRKVLGKKLHYDAIAEVDIYKFAPWDLPDKSRLRTGDLKWFFFCPREKKYASGARMNRATKFGYWKTTGKDRCVEYKDEVAGMIKTLVFHTGKAPKGDRTDWVMYEYRLAEKGLADQGVPQDAYVLSAVFKKNGPGPKNGAQYGAPFNEEDWDDDDQEEEVNVQEGVSLAGTSAPAFMVPAKHNGYIATSSHEPKSMCDGSSVSYQPKSLPSEYNPLHLGFDNNASKEAPQVQLEEANGHETVSFADVSAAPLTLPLNQNSSVMAISSASCPSEALWSAYKPQLMVSDIDVPYAKVSQVEPEEDDIIALLDIFDKDENVDNLNLDGNAVANPCSDGIDVFEGLGDLEPLFGDCSFAGNNSKYFVDQMPHGDNGQYLELMDLDIPLTCIPVTGGDEDVQAGALCADNNYFNYSEESCYPANPSSGAQLVTAFAQAPMLPHGPNGYDGQVNVFSKEDGVRRKANHDYSVYERALYNENDTHCETSEMGSRHASIAVRRE